MPLISQSSGRQQEQSFRRYEKPPEAPEFSEVFAASLGNVFDENLSISSMLNHEGRQQRNQIIRDKVKSGEVDLKQYRSQGRSKGIDYDRIAQDLEDPSILTDEQLREQRNRILETRRTYAEDTMARGSGAAQFLGALSGYMLDPINIASMGVSTPYGLSRATSTLGRIAMASRNNALIGGATELGIQPLVYAHRQEIDSPYSYVDAITAITMAAGGGAVLGAFEGGLRGYFGKVKKLADDLPASPEVEYAVKTIERMEATIAAAPKREINIDKIRAEVLEEARQELLNVSNGKVSDSDISNIKAEYAELSAKRKPTDYQIDGVYQRLKDERPFESDATLKAMAREQAEATMLMATENSAKKVKQLERQIEADKAAREAEKALVNMQKGVLPKKYQNRINEKVEKLRIESETEFLAQMAEGAERAAKPSRKPTDYDIPATPEPSKPTKPTEMSRVDAVMDNLGLKNEYEREMADFATLDAPLAFKDDSLIDANKVMKELDDDLSGLEQVLRCAIG